jgi:hypothetical protein
MKLNTNSNINIANVRFFVMDISWISFYLLANEH